jgi:hypothetical protein
MPEAVVGPAIRLPTHFAVAVTNVLQQLGQNGESMSAYWRMVILAAILFPVGLGKCDLWGQENAGIPSVLHIIIGIL